MKDVFGNTLGLKPSQLEALRRTYRRRVDAEAIVSPELARHLTELSHETHRQVGVFLDRGTHDIRHAAGEPRNCGRRERALV